MRFISDALIVNGNGPWMCRNALCQVLARQRRVAYPVGELRQAFESCRFVIAAGERSDCPFGVIVEIFASGWGCRVGVREKPDLDFRCLGHCAPLSCLEWGVAVSSHQRDAHHIAFLALLGGRV